MLYFVPHLLRKTPARWINLPNKAYWLKEEYKQRMVLLLSGMLFRFGVATFVFMFIVGLLSLLANLSDPVRLREDFFWWPLGMNMAYAVYWAVKIMRVFRVPREKPA